MCLPLLQHTLLSVQTGLLCLHVLQDAPSSYNSLRQQQQQQQQQYYPQQQQQDAQQQQQQQRRLASRAWPRPEQDVCKAISLRLKRADSTADVLEVIDEHSQRFNEVSLMLLGVTVLFCLRFLLNLQSRVQCELMYEHAAC
jgi:hypothetical protein